VTDGQTDGHMKTAYTALAQHRTVKIWQLMMYCHRILDANIKYFWGP